MDSIHLKINQILSSSMLPFYDDFFALLNEVSELLENEKTAYRPQAWDGKCGALLDFHKNDLPLIVVPDFHARPYFLDNILKYQIFEDANVFEALSQGRLMLLSVGDILHTERGTRERWTAAAAEFENEIFTGPAMSAEMQEGLSLWCALFELKRQFPENIHILKGNHENILNETGGGDFAFRKFVDEGEMCRSFVQEYYGDDILYLMNCVEQSLPLYYWGKKCSVSHAEPMRAFSKKELVDARKYPGVVKGLIWTNNGEAEENSAREIVKKLFDSSAEEIPAGYLHLGGHRPVQGNYRLLQKDFYVQIHNPSKENIVFVKNDRAINLESDIVDVRSSNE